MNYMKLEDFTKKEDNNLPKETCSNFDLIINDNIKEFTERSVKEFGSIEKSEQANKVAEVLIKLLKRKKLMDENTHQTFVDILLSAAFIHNLFYTKEDWTTLFHARRDLEKLAAKCCINKQMADALFHTVESQLGEETPLTECMPKPNTPTDLFSIAVWIAKEYM